MRDFSTLTETKRNVSLCLVLVLAVLSTQTLGQDIIDGEGNFFHFLRCLHLFFLRFKKLVRILMYLIAYCSILSSLVT